MDQSPVFAAEAIFDFLAPTATPALPNHLESPLLDTSSEDLDNQLLLDRTVAGKEPHRVSRRRVNERWFCQILYAFIAVSSNATVHYYS